MISPPADATPRPVWIIIGLGVVMMLAGLPGALTTTPDMRALTVVLGIFLLGDVPLLHIRFGRDHHSYTLSEVALVAGLWLLPLSWLQLVAPLAVAVAHLLARRSYLKVAFNAAALATGIVLAGGVYTLLDGATGSTARRCAALALATFVFFVWNTVSMSAAVASSQRLKFRTVYAKGLLLSFLVWLGNTSVGLLLVALAEFSPMSLMVMPLLLGLLYFLYWSYLRAMHERDVWQVLQSTSRQLLGTAEVARVVMGRTPALFGADFVELLLVDNEQSSSAVVYRWSARGGDEVSQARLNSSNPYWGRVLAEREPFEVIGRNAPAAHRRELASHGLAKCVVAPLLVKHSCVGTLRIGFRGDVRFGSRQMQVLTTFANHVSAAVHNTRLFEAMRFQALHDPLTRLANRTVLLDRLEHAQARSARTGESVAVLFLDLDRFKVINDSLGHDAGDQLLVAVADRLRAVLRPGDTAARFGGDEFVVLCEEINGPYEALAVAERIATTLQQSPFWIGDEQVFVTASVGVAIAATAQDDPAMLVRDADAAMYQAKARGPARCELFDKQMGERAAARLEMENDLRRAIEREELAVHYQPNVRLADGGVVGVEALARWEHPQRGSISPTEFIPLAEETGMIVALGAWVIQTACRQLAEWGRRDRLGAGDLYVSINLSPLQLAHPGLVGQISAALLSTGVDPASRCFEVTETALLDDMEEARDVLERLRALGVRIALDDFGTGYSSLSYLHELPVDVLKLDRSFIARLSPRPRDRAVVAGMVELAHALDLTVVAEGVETEEQLCDLRALQCDVVQGHHFYAAQPAIDLDDVLLSRRAKLRRDDHLVQVAPLASTA